MSGKTNISVLPDGVQNQMQMKSYSNIPIHVQTSFGKFKLLDDMACLAKTLKEFELVIEYATMGQELLKAAGLDTHQNLLRGELHMFHANFFLARLEDAKHHLAHAQEHPHKGFGVNTEESRKLLEAVHRLDFAMSGKRIHSLLRDSCEDRMQMANCKVYAEQPSDTRCLVDIQTPLELDRCNMLREMTCLAI